MNSTQQRAPRHLLEYSSSLKAVGEELQRARKSAGLTLRDLGNLADLSPGFLSMVERGECSLSLTSLFAVSDALDIPAPDLIQGGTRKDEKDRAFRVWRGIDDSAPRTVVGERDYTSLCATFPGRQLEPMLVHIEPTSTQAPLTSHEGEEFAYIVKGRLSFLIRDNELTLEAGQSIHFKSELPHAIRNDTTKTVEALWVVTPDFAAHTQHESRA